jgi:hypothetical protein
VTQLQPPPEIKKPTKQRVWTPNEEGAHTKAGYAKQTAAKKAYPEGQLPPKKSLKDLP